MGFLDGLPDLGLPDPPPQRRRAHPDVLVVVWIRPLCPKCGSANCPVIDSRGKPKRKHRCECGQEFWSYEQNYRGKTTEDTEDAEAP